VRRGAPAPHDVDVLVVADLRSVGFAPARPADRIVSFAARAAGPRRRELVVGWKKRAGAPPVRVRVDLFGAKPAELPWALFALSSARAYQVRVRAVAARRGFRLNQYGLFVRRTGRPAPGAAKVKSERGVAAAVGVRWRPAAARV
jgi:DNA polymerase/3'-5' exonuclease PolX